MKDHTHFKLFVMAILATAPIIARGFTCSLDEVATFKTDHDTAIAEVVNVQSQVERDNYVTSVMRKSLGTLPQSCQAELLRPITRDVQCERLNRLAYEREAQAIGLAQGQYMLNASIDEYWNSVYEINRAILSSTPSECWLQGVENKPENPRCTQQWQQYNECKQKVEDAIKRCTVMPGPCNDRGPTCFLPNCTQ